MEFSFHSSKGLLQYLHLANIGSFVVESLEERRDAEEAADPVVHDVPNAFAVRRESNLHSLIGNDPRKVRGAWSNGVGTYDSAN